MYTGTMIRDLHGLVNRTFAIHDNNTLCEYCYMPLGSHSHEGLNCPNPSDFGPLFATTRFSALLCSFQADADSEMCQSPMVVVETSDSGMGYCLKHFLREHEWKIRRRLPQ